MRAMAVFFLATALVGAKTDGALAQEPSSIGGAIGKVFDALDLRHEPPPPADFVVNSRPESLDYSPLAAPGSERRAKKKSPAELDRLEAELRAAAAENQRRALRVKTPDGQANAQKKKPTSASARSVPSKQN